LWANRGESFVDDQVLQQLREAYAALATGDVEAFAGVLDDEVHWRSAPRGLLRRRHMYWHGSEEAREVLRGQRDKLRATTPSATATVEVEPGDSEQAVVTFTIMPRRHEVFQVINIRHGRIVHIQDVRSRREARQLAGIGQQ
jgi:ketosteroid isomerase-like protein